MNILKKIIMNQLEDENITSTLYQRFLDGEGNREEFPTIQLNTKDLFDYMREHEGKTIYIPCLDFVGKFFRDEEIALKDSQGVDRDSTANRFDITRRRVDQILKEKYEKIKAKVKGKPEKE